MDCSTTFVRSVLLDESHPAHKRCLNMHKEPSVFDNRSPTTSPSRRHPSQPGSDERERSRPEKRPEWHWLSYSIYTCVIALL